MSELLCAVVAVLVWTVIWTAVGPRDLRKRVAELEEDLGDLEELHSELERRVESQHNDLLEKVTAGKGAAATAPPGTPPSPPSFRGPSSMSTRIAAYERDRARLAAERNKRSELP